MPSGKTLSAPMDSEGQQVSLSPVFCAKSSVERLSRVIFFDSSFYIFVTPWFSDTDVNMTEKHPRNKK
jgi:hypothetical protein